MYIILELTFVHVSKIHATQGFCTLIDAQKKKEAFKKSLMSLSLAEYNRLIHNKERHAALTQLDR